MTFLEKAMEIENETEKGLKREEVIQRYCPSSYDLEAGNGCRICWNREMPNTELVKTVTLPMPPNTEPKEDKPFTEKEVYEEAGYNKGINDAWELAKKIWSGKDNENVEIFGTKFVYEIYQLSPQEVIAKLKAYEEAQNKVVVGDVVKSKKMDSFVLLVLEIHDDVFTGFDGKETHRCMILDNFKKTGKHLDISSILEQIGE